MQWGNPPVLWLLLPWFALALAAVGAHLRRERFGRRIGEGRLLARLFPPGLERWRRQRTTLALTVLLLLVLAAARPQYGRIEQTMQSFGTNVIIALDCSPSMRTRDVLPSRIQRARQSMRWLINELPGHRVGIVSFAGTAFLSCPMTLDRNMARRTLESLDTQSVHLAGTNLGRAIRVATEAFERGAATGSRALVFISDGENHEPRLEEAARHAAEQNVVIYALGIGTRQGGAVPTDQGFIEDDQGRKVNSRLQMAALEQIARITGGVALEAGDRPNRAVLHLTHLIDRQEKTELEARKQIVHQDRFQWLLAPALVLMLWMLTRYPEPNRPGRRDTPVT